MKTEELPRWDMTNVYPSMDSDEFKADIRKLEEWIEELNDLAEEHDIGPNVGYLAESAQSIGVVCATFLEKIGAALSLYHTIHAYIYAFAITDTFDEDAKKQMSQLQATGAKLNYLEEVRFKGWLGKIKDRLPEIIKSHAVLKDHTFYLMETATLSNFLMSAPEEKLAGELALSGIRAWSELQADVVSQLTWSVQNEQDEAEELPITAIANLRYHPDEKMRRRGYDASMDAGASVENILAAALNGVKGTQLTQFNHRQREDAVHESLDQSRIDRATLDAMLEALRNRLPKLQKYYSIKAQRLGKESLPFWDVSASTAQTTTRYPYQQAQAFILDSFAAFSDELAAVASSAFDNNWIDVGPREGKGGGAFCMSLDAVEESRILLNYGDNHTWLFFLAHELGHAFHNHCLRGKSRFHRKLPMTLAETASMMCETIITNAAIEQATTEDEEFAILEASLDNAITALVFAYSGYLLESEVFKRRAKGKLSAQELNALCEWAQAEAYGEALDGEYPNRYLWAFWPHLFFPDLAFYNYPYAFGQLVGVGLYAVYQEHGSSFIPQFIDFLGNSGMDTAANLAARFGMDLRDPVFWERGLDVFVQKVERYASLSGQ